MTAISTLVMTGGSSGFGEIAAGGLRRLPDTHLLQGSRTATGSAESIPLDLASLASVRTFAAAVQDRLGPASIDGLILNAGLIRHDDTGTSHDGFETTFAVNHLAHYLLLRLLLPNMKPTAIVVMTTSGTHDPATKAELATPRHTDVALLSHPERDPDRAPKASKAGQHAYTASKLCTILTARAFADLAEVRERGIQVIAYDPGQVFGTGLARDLALPMRLAWGVFGRPVLGWPVRRFNGSLNTRDDAGKALADLASGRVSIPDGGSYVALRRGRLSWTEPSDMAREPERARTLWVDSAKLVDLPA